jgi:nicotinamidase-related amidase
MDTSSSTSKAPKDKKHTALLVIDVQQGLFMKSAPVYKAGELLRNITGLVDQAHRAGVPIFYIQHSDQRALIKGSKEWQLHPELQPEDRDCLIFKQHGNAFEGTDLDELLKAKKIGNLVITRLVTHGCVKATCLGAKELGYQVILVKDGHSSYSQKAAELIAEWNEKLCDEGVEVKNTAEIQFDLIAIP